MSPEIGVVHPKISTWKIRGRGFRQLPFPPHDPMYYFVNVFPLTFPHYKKRYYVQN